MSALLPYEGWALITLGALLVAWSWTGRRCGGRPRCPRCWYDMSALTGLVCSECGHVAKTPRRLFKPRRRWLALLFGVLVAMGGVTLLNHAAIGSHGWLAGVPTSVLITVMPAFDDPAHPALLELDRRLGRSDVPRPDPPELALPRWQRRWLARRCGVALSNAEVDAEAERPLTLLQALGADARPAIPHLLRLRDDRLGPRVQGVLGRFPEDAATIVPGLHDRLADAGPPTRRWIYELLGGMGPAAAPVLPQLLEDRRAGTIPESLALDVIIDIGVPVRSAVPALLEIAADPESDRRVRALRGLGDVATAEPEVVRALVEAVLDGDRPACRAALHSLAKLTGSTETALVAVEAALRSRDRVERLHALLAAAVIDDPERLGDALRASLEHEDEMVRLAAAAALAGPDQPSSIRGSAHR